MGEPELRFRALPPNMVPRDRQQAAKKPRGGPRGPEDAPKRPMRPPRGPQEASKRPLERPQRGPKRQGAAESPLFGRLKALLGAAWAVLERDRGPLAPPLSVGSPSRRESNQVTTCSKPMHTCMISPFPMPPLSLPRPSLRPSLAYSRTVPVGVHRRGRTMLCHTCAF